MDKKWTTSLDGEIFNGEMFDTREEAVKSLVDDLPAEELKDAWVGQIRELHVAQFVDVENLIEDMQVKADDAAGESAEDWLRYITKEERDELEKLIIDWFEKKGEKPTFYGIEKTEKILK